MSNNDSRDSGSTNGAVSPDAEPQAAPAGLTGRREVLKVGGIAFAAALLPEWLPGCGSSHSGGGAEKVASHAQALTPITSLSPTVNDANWFEVVRPQDMLRVRMNFVQLHHDVPSNSLVVDSGQSNGIILIEFPPQHIDEQTVPQLATQPPTNEPSPPVSAQISGVSRIAFVVPSGTTVPYSLTGLLNACTQLTLNVPPNALTAKDDVLPATPTATNSADPDTAVSNLLQVTTLRVSADANSDAAPPADDIQTGTNATLSPSQPVEAQTSIELPYRVMVSPSSALRFAHASAPYQPGSSAFTELWTTRLARASSSPSGVDDSARVPVSARAVWSPDIGTSPPSDPITNPTFAPALRGSLSTQTSDFQNAATTGVNTIPFHARRLLLSARGGSLDSYAEFPQAGLGGLLNWQHRASFGRDNYVRTEQVGQLFPWGHTASLVTISERKFLANPNNGGGARTGYIWQQQFLIIRRPVVDYLDPAGQFLNAYQDFLNFPFKKIRLLTMSTPPLDVATSTPFVPSINGGTAFRFAAQFVDREDNVHKSELAGFFVTSVPDMLTALPLFNAGTSDANGPLNGIQFRRQRIAYADPVTGKRGATTHETQLMTFVATELESAIGPFMEVATINVPATRQFSGDDESLNVTYTDTFTHQGFSSTVNKGEVYLSLANASPAHVSFGAQSQRGGGFMTPNMAIIGFSRSAGPLTGTAAATSADDAGTVIGDQLANFAANAQVDPKKMLAGALSQAKLFGCFSLADMFGTSLLDAVSLPKFASEVLDEIGTLVRTLTKLTDGLNTISNTLSSGAIPTGFSGQVTTLSNDVDSLIGTLSNFPPNASTAATQIAAIGTDLGALQTTLAQAWRNNDALPFSSQLPDVDFSQATSLLRGASSIVNSGTTISNALSAIQNLGQTTQNLTSHFTWQTAGGVIQPIGLSSSVPKVFEPNISGKPQTVLKVTGEVRAHEVAGKPAGLDLTAVLNDFNINLIGSGNLAFITAYFKRLGFTTLAGQKPSVDVGFGGITFDGPLSFLNLLKKIIPLNGFSDPPSINVDSRGLTAGFGIHLPALSIGVFTLENINLGATLDIPFIGEAMTLGFHFAERDNPFHLTVSLLGGGGYFMMDLSLSGVVLIEAGLEFGAEASVNLVVASGTVLVMGGISIIYVPAGSSGGQPSGVNLTGYVRMAGSLSVLGLITTSVEMRMSLSYEPGTGHVKGSATISVEVSIMFFSESVSITCSKTFSACNADPIFADQMGPLVTGGPPAWNDYCAAFAA